MSVSFVWWSTKSWKFPKSLEYYWYSKIKFISTYWFIGIDHRQMDFKFPNRPRQITLYDLIIVLLIRGLDQKLDVSWWFGVGSGCVSQLFTACCTGGQFSWRVCGISFIHNDGVLVAQANLRMSEFQWLIFIRRFLLWFVMLSIFFFILFSYYLFLLYITCFTVTC